MTEPDLHPLLDQDDSGKNINTHYDQLEEPAILTLEKQESIQALINWAQITIKKYQLRLGFKDQVENEKRKIAAYTRYYNMLRGLAVKDSAILEMTAEKAYEKHHIQWKYR